MNIILLVILGLGLCATLWILFTYNHLIKLQSMVQEALSGIDVQLKRRFDLIPNLVATVKGYAQHEKSVLEQVTALRTQSIHATTVAEKAQADGNLTQALKTLFAVAENYPQLKANENFLALQKDLASIEDELQLSRRYYNGTVRNYTIGLRKFPSNLVAKMGSFESYPYFTIDNEKERANPQVNF